MKPSANSSQRVLVPQPPSAWYPPVGSNQRVERSFFVAHSPSAHCILGRAMGQTGCAAEKRVLARRKREDSGCNFPLRSLVIPSFRKREEQGGMITGLHLNRGGPASRHAVGLRLAVFWGTSDADYIPKQILAQASQVELPKDIATVTGISLWRTAILLGYQTYIKLGTTTRCGKKRPSSNGHRRCGGIATRLTRGLY